jgi:hypothetical protein
LLISVTIEVAKLTWSAKLMKRKYNQEVLKIKNFIMW